MKKMFLIGMLAIASSVGMTSRAGNWCMPSVRTDAEPWIEVQGIFQAAGFPCEPDEDCADCMTIVLVTSDKTYYLVTDEGKLIEQLDNVELGTTATVSGMPFIKGSYDYIQVSHINSSPLRLNSLCDEWNMLGIAYWDGNNHFETFTQTLTTDTVISGNLSVKLEQNGKHLGAMREGENRDIYYVPNGSTHEYLLYAFNAQVGDTLRNTWIGAYEYSGKRATVREIKATNPRIFIVAYEYGSMDIWEEYLWIEGVGMIFGPSGHYCPFDCAGDYGEVVLCAYKNGEQVYISEWGEQYGCSFEKQAIDLTTSPASIAEKFIRDGQLYIIRGEKTYTIDGQEVR